MDADRDLDKFYETVMKLVDEVGQHPDSVRFVDFFQMNLSNSTGLENESKMNQ